VHTYPYLVKIEFIAAILVLALLMVWSVRLDAPLEEPANPNFTPNPAKAPWYFLGLQDMLVYFDPWIAGVAVPTLIIIGLMAIPYLDAKPHVGSGTYLFAARRFEILTFWFGFFVLWVMEILIGTFVRGPGWMWFWPWQEWDPHRVLAETNVNLNEWLAGLLHLPALTAPAAGFVLGLVAVAGYYAVAFAVSHRYLKQRSPDELMRLGLLRFALKAFFFWTMLALPIKMALRLLFHIKYVWVTPWFNI
jgi:hypothetical protein